LFINDFYLLGSVIYYSLWFFHAYFFNLIILIIAD